MCEICRQNPCAAGCPNYDEEPLMYCEGCDKPIYQDDVYYEVNDIILCEDCIYDCMRHADRDADYHNDGQPVISYGDKWEV